MSKIDFKITHRWLVHVGPELDNDLKRWFRKNIGSITIEELNDTVGDYLGYISIIKRKVTEYQNYHYDYLGRMIVDKVGHRYQYHNDTTQIPKINFVNGEWVTYPYKKDKVVGIFPWLQRIILCLV